MKNIHTTDCLVPLFPYILQLSGYICIVFSSFSSLRMKETCVSNYVTPETAVLDKITNETIIEVKKPKTKLKSRVERNSLNGN